MFLPCDGFRFVMSFVLMPSPHACWLQLEGYRAYTFVVSRSVLRLRGSNPACQTGEINMRFFLLWLLRSRCVSSSFLCVSSTCRESRRVASHSTASGSQSHACHVPTCLSRLITGIRVSKDRKTAAGLEVVIVDLGEQGLP